MCSHPWFSSLDWDALYKKELEPEFKPELGDLEDVSQFGAEFTDMDITPSAVATSDLEMVAKRREDFSDFS